MRDKNASKILGCQKTLNHLVIFSIVLQSKNFRIKKEGAAKKIKNTRIQLKEVCILLVCVLRWKKRKLVKA